MFRKPKQIYCRIIKVLNYSCERTRTHTFTPSNSYTHARTQPSIQTESVRVCRLNNSEATISCIVPLHRARLCERQLCLRCVCVCLCVYKSAIVHILELLPLPLYVVCLALPSCTRPMPGTRQPRTVFTQSSSNNNAVTSTLTDTN